MTPVPLSLCHLDGTIVKSDKSTLTRKIESEIEDHGYPDSTDILIIDGIFLLHRLKQLPQKFGDIAIEILKMITRDDKGHHMTGKQIYLIFDLYKSPSIKDKERSLRGSYSEEFSIYSKQFFF